MVSNTRDLNLNQPGNLTIASVSLNAAGTGYLAGESADIFGGVGSAVSQIRIDTVGGSGEILTFTLLNGGSYTTLPPDPAFVSGTGAGGLVNLDVTRNFSTVKMSSTDTNIIELYKNSGTLTALFDKVSGQLQVGDIPEGNIVISSENGMEFEGNARYTGRADFGAEIVSGGGVNPPNEIVLFGNKFALSFANSQEDEIFLTNVAASTIDFTEDLEVIITWSPNNTDVGICQWRLDFSNTSDGGSLNNTITTYNINDIAAGTANDLQKTPTLLIPANTFSADDLLSIRLYRLSTDGFTGAARFLNVSFSILKTELGV